MSHAASAQAPTSDSSNATAFTMYNGTTYPNASILMGYGLVRATLLYDEWGLSCSTTGCSNVPSEATFKDYVQNRIQYYGASNLISMDFENVVPVRASSDDQARQEVAMFKQFITCTRDVAPDAKIGEYDYDYNYNNSASNSRNVIRAELYQSGGFNFFGPTLYQRWATHADWQGYLNASIEHDRAISSTIPIYPFISPNPSGTPSATNFLSDAEWESELSDLKSNTNGGIVWVGSARGTLNTSWDWVEELKSFMSSL
ncbi:MAG TPA: hypothetical protein VGG18_13305 [Granulicella sp.]